MPTYALLSGEAVDYDATPELAAFLERAEAYVQDPDVSVSDMVELLYGEENPLLVKGVIAGRGFVTAEVLAHPAYRVMVDMLDRKRIQLGKLHPAAVEAAHSLTVVDAAKRLGISTGAVRQAITGGRLAAIKRNGQYWLRPEALASYRVSRKGPAASAVRAPALRVRIGTEGDTVMQLKHDGQLETVRTGHVDEGELTGWTWAAVKSARKDLGSLHVYHLRPGPLENELVLGGLFVRGRFDIAARVHGVKEAAQAWKEVDQSP